MYRKMDRKGERNMRYRFLEIRYSYRYKYRGESRYIREEGLEIYIYIGRKIRNIDISIYIWREIRY